MVPLGLSINRFAMDLRSLSDPGHNPLRGAGPYQINLDRLPSICLTPRWIGRVFVPHRRGARDDLARAPSVVPEHVCEVSSIVNVQAPASDESCS